MWDNFKKCAQRQVGGADDPDEMQMNNLRISDDVDPNANPLPLASTAPGVAGPARSRPTQATGAIPRNTNRPTTEPLESVADDVPPIPPPRYKKIRSQRLPLPGESNPWDGPEPTTSTACDNHNSLHMAAEPRCPGPMYADQVPRIRPRQWDELTRREYRPPVYRQPPTQHSIRRISERSDSPMEECGSSACSAGATSMLGPPSSPNCCSVPRRRRNSASSGSSYDSHSSSSGPSYFDLASNFNAPSNKRSIEYFQMQARLAYEANPPPRRLPDPSQKNDSNPRIPSVSQLNITMNPSFIDDGSDIVEVTAGQKAAAEVKRLTAIMAEAGVRSSSMPPLSMPPRIVHGNVARPGPAYLGVPEQFATAVRPHLNVVRGRSSSTEPPSSRSTSSDARYSSTDSGCDNMSSESPHQHSRRSSAGSIPRPANMSPSPTRRPFAVEQRTHQSRDLVRRFHEEMKMYEYRRRTSNICYECCGLIKDEDEACFAMGHTYHAKCFICIFCKLSLSGKGFYNVKGTIYCYTDYMNIGIYKTAEQCDACGTTICDMIVIAMKKHLHPKCFRCFQCKCRLDETTFTMDQMGRLHCDNCYHEKHAPRCSCCGRAIHPSLNSREVVRVVSRNEDFHFDCYRCELCDILLTSEERNECCPIGLHLLCFPCNRLYQTSTLPEGSPIAAPVAVQCTHA